MYPTTISSWALVVAKTLEDYGVDSKSIFKQAGLNPSQLHDPDSRYPVPGMVNLWLLATEATGDPCFGLNVVKHWHPTTLHALGYAWFASHTLKEGFERMERYVHIACTATTASLRETTDGYEFRLGVLPEYKPSPDFAAVDAGMATILHMCRQSCGEEFNPIRLELVRPMPDRAEKFYEYFQSQIIFNSDENQFLFEKYCIEKSLPTANVDLALANEKIIREYLNRLDRSDILTRVQTLLSENLTSGNITEKQMADMLNMSVRSLQRKLEEQGQNYKSLLDETRRELAIQYIRNSRYSINEITYLLGFSEASNFSRAFKRWTGSSPSHYRQTELLEVAS
ncbi:MAG: AraC family transcriptional regulator [Gammaproteobacteria bacterium]|nr:helix-turn-helix domain-containing protein [Gammaproteobacteria bacterium]NIO61796.1 helix-turn-helix domain-containing protein [Gammaproteobacteria bacterium]NIP48667.1 AraC family transcriptional regulator [Gammaproteobacteria bacterium]NIQ09119.1 AraC family transcriptional regulator [Gammaproteobacteria bacterium]NIQ19047.1 helix-turn-helix domain-containing protein [Gammaproteobacteria bacterium]